jgi:hypothetical protein
MGKITNIQKKVPKETTLPDGIYSGIWGSYIIALAYNGAEYALTTEEGVRGFGIKVVVTIKDGVATYECIKN